ncbi:hypothetical protein JVT61DRAFT_13012 [Boletus reticuloceps]|uniref:Uncharacterized protein n=1 Tax=Boletus reticuloceps TaxID=495285 RepID=A0A8I2YT63_9AGAM|nr:hypothetical protein JVT61DRAFT_13012 [Boletus reticuloceps]
MDDIDVESLQAQVDMSMSFAQNLVTSWIKPTHFAQLRSSGTNATQILEEELRRPPRYLMIFSVHGLTKQNLYRLGVGASIPTVPPMSHEVSKLTRRLGKNRAKHESVVESQPQNPLKSDDEEHKGRPTKRKTKADPFGHEGRKKKRKAESTANPYPSVENVSTNPVSLLKETAFGEPAKHNSSSEKEKRRTGLGKQQSHVTEGRRSATPVSSSPVGLPVQTTFSQSLTALTVPSLMKPSREISVPVPGDPTTPKSSRVHTNLPDKAKPLGIPLLNLDGPPECVDKPGDTGKLNKTRQKRRRRKRKKTQMIASTGDN